ncbi:MAG: hypothetical protein EHM13_12625 [Acidobacteria bacterium]|nr:MAG: hypothetical protein EHM13_12625 [Acidobacteriota bacterium]
MTAITATSTLPDVALAVGAVLSRHRICAVLTGGACVSIYTNGLYVSRDADFVILRAVPGLQRRLDEALASLGFVRDRDRYVHNLTPFFVEFPPGPLSIGRDLRIKPVKVKVGDATALLLSPTDSCRDRLASFYFWGDRQALDFAVAIARRHEVNFRAIRRWSKDEGELQKYGEFRHEVGRHAREA